MHLLLLLDAVWWYYMVVGCILTEMNCGPQIWRKSPQFSCQKSGLVCSQIRCPGKISEENWGQEREVGKAQAKLDEKQVIPLSWRCQRALWWKSWVKFGKSLRSKNLRYQRPSFFLPWRKLKSHFDDIHFVFVFFPSNDGTVNRAVRVNGLHDAESLELCEIESFSGLGSRSADEARLNIANRSWKICTCAGFASTPAALGLVPSWESGYKCADVHMCTSTHAFTCTL